MRHFQFVDRSWSANKRKARSAATADKIAELKAWLAKDAKTPLNGSPGLTPKERARIQMRVRSALVAQTWHGVRHKPRGY